MSRDLIPSQAGRRAELYGLPHPIHLFEFLTDSQHYHLGLAPRDGEPLSAAMDRLVAASLDRLPAGARVLDVGACLGGTLALLARSGFAAVGIDPDARPLAYARKLLPAAVELVPCALHEYESEPIDAILLTEVLQHHPDLDVLLRHCRSLLVDGGVVLVHDAAVHVAVSFERVPYHPDGALARAAQGAGLVVEERVDLTAQVAPTLPRLAREVLEQRAAIVAFFARRAGVEDELTELHAHLRQLEAGFRDGHLTYELTVLRRPALSSA